MSFLTKKFMLGLPIVTIATTLLTPVSAAAATPVDVTSGGYFCWRLYNNMPVTTDPDAYARAGVLDYAVQCFDETQEGSS